MIVNHFIAHLYHKLKCLANLTFVFICVFCDCRQPRIRRGGGLRGPAPLSLLKLVIKQGGNSNLDCVPRTAIVAMSDGGGGGGAGVGCVCVWGGGLSSNFVHQMCHQGGGWESGRGRGREGGGREGEEEGLSARFPPKFWQAISPQLDASLLANFHRM